MSVLYRDGAILCDDDGVTIEGYYFPFGSDKRIGYPEIQRIESFAMGTFTGRYRIWGTGHPRYWLHLDWNRPRKDRALVLDLGRFVRPVITPEDCDAVAKILEQKTALRVEPR